MPLQATDSLNFSLYHMLCQNEFSKKIQYNKTIMNFVYDNEQVLTDANLPNNSRSIAVFNYWPGYLQYELNRTQRGRVREVCSKNLIMQYLVLKVDI